MNDPVANESRRDGVSIYDVARRAGVSPSTVSRAFTRPGRVSTRTAAKVYQAAEDLGYKKVNPEARAQDASTRIVSVLTSDIDNPIIVDVVRALQATLEPHGYIVMVVDTHESELSERNLFSRAITFSDGAILASTRLSNHTIQKSFARKPLVVLNRETAGVACTVPDYTTGINRAVSLLAELGHRSITYLSGPELSQANEVRWRSIQDAAEKVGLSSQATPPLSPTAAGGRHGGEIFAESRTSAVIAYNDLMAVGFAERAAEVGITSPADYSLIGFDNIRIAAHANPSITTIDTNQGMQSELAARSLLLQMSGKRLSRAVMRVPAALIVRETTGAAPQTQKAGIPRRLQADSGS